jgi:hypothetical protein
MYQRYIFSGVRQYIGEQLLLKSIFYTVNLKRFIATLPLILVLSQGILLYYGVYRMYTDFTLREKPDERQSELLSSLPVTPCM